MNPVGRQDFILKIRIPGWVRNQVVPSNLYSYNDGKRLNFSIALNGKELPAQELTDGYFCIDRKWSKGDKVEVHFEMQPRTVKANPNVEADKGKIAVERGPIVYCAEWPDNDFDILSTFMNQKPQFELIEKPDLLSGIIQLRTDAQVLRYDDRGRLQTQDVKLNLIPYYAWAHRGSGNMAVWLAQDLSASRPTMPPTLASESKISVSHRAGSISSINDRLVPNSPEDRSVPYYHWWPKENTVEWIAYEFKEEAEISSTMVFWFDDGPWGGCRVPKAWKIYYKDSQGNWQPVNNIDEYGRQKGLPNQVRFEPVKTTAVKLEVALPERHASGVFEWEIN